MSQKDHVQTSEYVRMTHFIYIRESVEINCHIITYVGCISYKVCWSSLSVCLVIQLERVLVKKLIFGGLFKYKLKSLIAWKNSGRERRSENGKMEYGNGCFNDGINAKYKLRAQ